MPVEDQIREQLLNAGPPPGSPQASRFPQCVDWILRNQRGDGSWGSAPGRDIGGKPRSLLGDFVILEDLPARSSKMLIGVGFTCVRS